MHNRSTAFRKCGSDRVFISVVWQISDVKSIAHVVWLIKQLRGIATSQVSYISRDCSARAVLPRLSAILLLIGLRKAYPPNTVLHLP